MSLEGNLKLMKTLDDAWNGQDWDTFNMRHAETAEIYWLGKPHQQEGKKTISMNRWDCLFKNVINLSLCPKVSKPIFIDIHIFLN
jgi:hypothetical protein